MPSKVKRERRNAHAFNLRSKTAKVSLEELSSPTDDPSKQFGRMPPTFDEEPKPPAIYRYSLSNEGTSPDPPRTSNFTDYASRSKWRRSKSFDSTNDYPHHPFEPEEPEGPKYTKSEPCLEHASLESESEYSADAESTPIKDSLERTAARLRSLLQTCAAERLRIASSETVTDESSQPEYEYEEVSLVSDTSSDALLSASVDDSDFDWETIDVLDLQDSEPVTVSTEVLKRIVDDDWEHIDSDVMISPERQAKPTK